MQVDFPLLQRAFFLLPLLLLVVFVSVLFITNDRVGRVCFLLCYECRMCRRKKVHIDQRDH